MKKSDKKSGSLSSITGKFIISLILAGIIFYFLSIKYDSLILNAGASIISFLLFFLSWKRYGFFYFMLAFFTSGFIFSALEISFELGIIANFIIAIVITMIGLHIYCKKETDSSYAWILLGLFVIIWIILSFNVKYPSDWKLENYLVVPSVLLLLLVSKWFKLSKTSYVLIFIFMTLHIIGGHYTYAEVPFGYWMQNLLGLASNRYDRVVHFLFGFLLAYPVREIMVRVGNAKGIWALWGPVELVFGLSAIYEIIEWISAIVFGGDLGIAFLGSQGDIWDAQKDMLLAGLGSIIAMGITAITIFAYRGKDYLHEIIYSFKVKKGELGERALERFKKS